MRRLPTRSSRGESESNQTLANKKETLILVFKIVVKDNHRLLMFHWNRKWKWSGKNNLIGEFIFAMSFTLSLVCVFNACTERQRINPLDPENSETGGHPTGLAVVSILDTVKLRWNRLNLQDLSQYEIYRRLEGEIGFRSIGSVGKNRTTFSEISRRFGRQHIYRISARIGEFETALSDSVAITPGPTVAWITDFDNSSIIKLTHDGQHEILRSQVFFNPFRLAIDLNRKSVWVLDQFSGEFGCIDEQGELKGIYRRYLSATDMALDPVNGRVWVADSLMRSLDRFNADGSVSVELDSFPKISALAFNRRVNELWALVSNSDLLLRIKDRNGAIQIVETRTGVAGTARDIDIHRSSGAAWVAIGGRVIRLTASAQNPLVAEHRFSSPIRLAVDQNTGDCWAIDSSNQIGRSRVVKINPSGRTEFVIDGFSRPQGLSVNPFDSSCYVTDTLGSRVVIISNTGEMTFGFDRALTPVDIAIVSLINSSSN